MQLQSVRYEYKPDNALGLQSSYLLVNNDPILWSMLNAI